MTDILDDLRAYLAGDNAVVMSPRRVSEMIAAFDGLRAAVIEECAKKVEDDQYPCIGDSRRVAAAIRKLLEGSRE